MAAVASSVRLDGEYIEVGLLNHEDVVEDDELSLNGDTKLPVTNDRYLVSVH